MTRNRISARWLTVFYNVAKNSRFLRNGSNVNEHFASTLAGTCSLAFRTSTALRSNGSHKQRENFGVDSKRQVFQVIIAEIRFSRRAGSAEQITVINT